MHGSWPSTTSAVEIQMIPTHSQQPISKRKGHDDGNPLANATKKVRKEGSKAGPSNKRKLNGEEQPGGLVIVRAPSARPWNVQASDAVAAGLQPQPRAASRPPSSQSHHPHHLDSTKPPSKKFKADGSTTTARQMSKGMDRELYPSVRAEPEVDEDVRQMQSEADTLRRKSQAAESSIGTLNSAIQFLPSKSGRQQGPPSNQRILDASLALSSQETPQIERNRFMREGSNHRRKRSLSRGKRISSSYEATGVISHPHTSVSDSSFYKHIDGDLPEPARARQLLIWCSYRAMNEQSDQTQQASSSKRRQSKQPGKDPPPSVEDAQLLRRVEENVIRMLAEKRVDTNVYGAADSEDSRPKRENEQNVKNRAREIRFNTHIQQSKAEEDAWLEVTDHYNAFRTEVLAALDQFASAKAKGKQRASVDQVDGWDVNIQDIPEHFRGSANIDLAHNVVSPGDGKDSALNSRLEDLEYTMDRLHALTNSALETTRTAEVDLDRRFVLLNISLALRSPSLPSTLPSTSGALSSCLPSSVSRPSPTTDPQELLRALSRIDAERPRNQVGDAARRAVREVQRATDAPGGMAERRLTGVPPPTPRKLPGTPRRATTPGRGK